MRMYALLTHGNQSPYGAENPLVGLVSLAIIKLDLAELAEYLRCTCDQLHEDLGRLGFHPVPEDGLPRTDAHGRRIEEQYGLYFRPGLNMHLTDRQRDLLFARSDEVFKKG